MDFKLPELGEGIYEAELIRWLVKPGQSVRGGQGLMEVMTDKATMEVPSPFSGTIESLAAEEGRQLKVGEVVLTYFKADRKTEGERGRKGDGAKEAEQESRRGDGVAQVAQASDGKQQKAKKEKALSEANGGPRTSDRKAVGMQPKASPSVRLMARNLGIDLNRLHGSGPGGRILIEDLSSQVKASIANEEPIQSKEPHPTQDYGKPGTRIKLQGIRRMMADHMTRAKQLIPHAAYVDECDVTELVKLRESLREPFAKSGIKLTYLPFFVKAVTAALGEIPIVNSSLDDQGEIILHDHCHIGVATATAAGLIVPVVHDADMKDLPAIARELDRLASDAKSGKSRLEDLKGGTFTITSIGGYGGLISTPIVNHPQTAILGLGKIIKRPVYDTAGNLRPADLLYLSLSFDHRVLDGAMAAAFCNAVIRRLQSPAALLLPDKLN
jgi:pyruvate dehydrogenase E2 component (dihydrolipoamide acetyltransferase)/2-oxoisovalerate dehydrogenase E2 component (dihydrolipoyl transacylase)